MTRRIHTAAATALLFVVAHVASSAELEVSKAEAAGLSSERLERVNRVMQDYVDEGELSGVVTLIFRKGRVAHFETFGLSDLEKKQPMARDAIFRIFSMSKPITSVAVMMLFEEGRFQLDDPVARFIPGLGEAKVFAGETATGIDTVTQKRPMTIRHLLMHTSGITYGSADHPVERLYESAGLQASRDLAEVVAKLAKLPLMHQPGAAWNYGMSTDVLGYLVEVVSGQPFGEFLESRIFGPLDMHDTGFKVPEEKLGRFVKAYSIGEDKQLVRATDHYMNEKYLEGRLHLGGEGLVSTTADYLRFARMVLHGGEVDGVRLLGRKTVALMCANHLRGEEITTWWARGPGFGFGLGFGVVKDFALSGDLRSAGSVSWDGYGGTSFWVDPEEDLVAIMLNQTYPLGSHPAYREFKQLTYQAIVD
jgi:CubicO group peptidase (beta-lactamase class C family)